MKKVVFLIVTLLFAGCAEREPKVVYVDRFNEVKVPQKCVVPETECIIQRSATYTEVVKEMRLCIEELKRNSEVCK